MPHRGAAETVQAFVSAINSQDIEQLCSLMSREHLFVDAVGERIQGVDELREAWREFFSACPHYAMVVDSVTTSDDTVGLFGTAAGMHGPPGEGYGMGDDAIPAAWRATVRDGLVTEWRVFCNIQTIVHAVEIPQRASTGTRVQHGRVSHIELYVSNLDRSVAFWSWFLEALGYAPYQTWPTGRSWRLGDCYIVLVQTEVAHLDPPYHRKRAGLNHLAFHAASRERVDHITEQLRARGVAILYQDRHPYAGGPDTYAVYFEDPDRIKLEVVAS